MTGALVYLQVTSLINAVRQRLLRLRQPRYLIGTIIGLAYFYFFFFRHHTYPQGARAGTAVASANLGTLIGISAAALIMVGRIVYTWIFSGERASLAFSEAEVAFLFQAPLSRRTLVNYKLLKSQWRILFSAAVFSLVSNRFGDLGGNGWTHAVGWWILLSVLELHGIGASFARERLLHFGLNPARRRVLLGGALVLGLFAVGAWLSRTLTWPSATDLASAETILRYAERALATPPLTWILIPARWVLDPFFAPDLAAFIRALGPALVVLAAHYFWVIRADVSFEEASIALARRRAERAALRGGSARAVPELVRRRAPFVLPSRGPVQIAFLWRNLIAAGPWLYPRTLLLAAGVGLAVLLWLAAHPAYRAALMVAQVFAIPVSLWVLIVGPMLMRREVRLMMHRLDVVKTYPLRGWQVVLGELLAPMLLITVLEWLVLGAAAIVTAALNRNFGTVALYGGVGFIGAGLLVPPVAGLMIAIPFAATLYFPTWLPASGTGGGVEVMGQRLLFGAGYLVILIVALLPAAAAAALPYFVLRYFAAESVALLAAALAAGLVLAGELGLVVWWLGGRYEHFDLSVELPQ